MIETAQRYATAVKIIACIAMFIDHFAYIYAYRLGAVAYYVCRGIGRIAFPIFCFMIVEGVIHTRSLKKYLLRLTVFAVLLEAPSDLFLTGEVFSLEVQSVIITLLICACCVSLLKAVEERVHESGNIYLYWAVIVAAGCVLAEVSKGDYGYIGVVYASVFYIFRRKPRHVTACFCDVVMCHLCGEDHLWRIFHIWRCVPVLDAGGNSAVDV